MKMNLNRFRLTAIAGIASSLLLALPAGTARAVPALSFTGGSPTSNPSGGSVYGWVFDVTSSTTVAQLGVYDVGGNGLAESHQIGVWNAAGTLLASTTIAAGSGATLLDGFRYVDIADIALGAGSGYVIGVTNMDVDEFIADVSSVATVASISYGGSRFINSGGALAMPTNTIGRVAYFGPNFLTGDPAAVPEPATLALLGLGLAGLGLRRRIA